MQLGFKQIEYFRAVMVTGTVNGAAELLNVSQPSVSRMLKYTEARLGVQLFERRGGRLHATPEANALFREVRSLHSHLESLQENVRLIVRGEAERFPIGASPSLGRFVVPSLLSQLRKSFPSLPVKLDILSVSQVIDYLTYGMGECVCTIFPVDHPQIETDEFATGGLVCAVPRKHRLASRSEIEVAELASETLIGFDASTPHGKVVASFFDQVAMAPKFLTIVRFAETACAMAQQGHGVALVDEFTLSGGVFPDLVAIRLKCGQPFRVYLHRSSARPLSLAGRKFRELLSRWKPALAAG
jgi:DNA-binding transcriptional LysR family regulator